MPEVDSVAEFKKGLTLLRNNCARDAVECFARAVDSDKKNPFYYSYLGLAIATSGHNWDTAEDICMRAIKMSRSQPELYINLAEVYRMAGRRSEAIETLTSGMVMTKRDGRIGRALDRFGRRRSPVIPFLERDNFLNRGLGRLRSRLSKSA